LDFHFPRHQQDKQFQKYRRLVPHHLLYRLAAAATEGKMHLADGVGVKRMTRTLGVSAKVSSRPPPGSHPPPPSRLAPPPHARPGSPPLSITMNSQPPRLQLCKKGA